MKVGEMFGNLLMFVCDVGLVACFAALFVLIIGGFIDTNTNNQLKCIDSKIETISNDTMVYLNVIMCTKDGTNYYLKRLQNG